MICFKYQLKCDLLVVTNSTVGNGSVLPIVDCHHFGWFSSSITLSFNLLDVLDLCFRTSSIRTGIYSYNFFVLAGVASHFFVCFLNFLECKYSPDLYCAWSLSAWKLWSKQQVVLLYGMTGFCNKTNSKCTSTSALLERGPLGRIYMPVATMLWKIPIFQCV